MSQGRSTRCIGDGKPPTLNRESDPYNGVYKPLRTWVDDHPILYGNNRSLDPSTYTIHGTGIFTYPKDHIIGPSNGRV